MTIKHIQYIQTIDACTIGCKEQLPNTIMHLNMCNMSKNNHPTCIEKKKQKNNNCQHKQKKIHKSNTIK